MRYNETSAFQSFRTPDYTRTDSKVQTSLKVSPGFRTTATISRSESSTYERHGATVDVDYVPKILQIHRWSKFISNSTWKSSAVKTCDTQVKVKLTLYINSELLLKYVFAVVLIFIYRQLFTRILMSCVWAPFIFTVFNQSSFNSAHTYLLLLVNHINH